MNWEKEAEKIVGSVPVHCFHNESIRTHRRGTAELIDVFAKALKGAYGRGGADADTHYFRGHNDGYRKGLEDAVEIVSKKDPLEINSWGWEDGDPVRLAEDTQEYFANAIKDKLKSMEE